DVVSVDRSCAPSDRARRPCVRSFSYRVTPSSGLTLGPVIPNKLNWEATWNNAFSFAGSRCIARTSPETQQTFTLPARIFLSLILVFQCLDEIMGDLPITMFRC